MIRKLFYILLALGISAGIGCKSSKTLLQSGDYDAAVRKSAQKLQKNPGNVKELPILQEAYVKAQQHDIDKANFLKKSGQPDIWDDVMAIYANMKSRQELVKTLRNLPYMLTYINCDDEIINARNHAAEYFYAHATVLLNAGTRASARAAYNEFNKVKSYFTVYKDIDTQLAIAEERGISRVLFKLRNKTFVPLPPQMERELLKMTIQDLNTKWVKYFNREEEGLQFDYVILADMKLIDISPEGLKETRYTESRDIEDGYEYQLDKKGNVMKDDKGNDIKKPKYRTISCDIIETRQQKSARIAGNIDYINTVSNQLIKTSPIIADAYFDHYSADARGNLDALTPESRRKVGGGLLPFPPNADILMQAGVILKKQIKDIVWNNCELLN